MRLALSSIASSPPPPRRRMGSRIASRFLPTFVLFPTLRAIDHMISSTESRYIAFRSSGVDGVSVPSFAGECLAGDVGVPIHEGTVGVLLPCPHVKRVERWQPEAIRAFEIMEELSHELWRPLPRMSLVPVACNHQKVGANQLQVTVWHRLIDHDLGTPGVDFTEPHQLHIHEVEPHRPGIWPRDAAE